MRATASLIVCLLAASLLTKSAPLQADESSNQRQTTVRPGPHLTAEELASLLGAHVWKLDVSLPAGAKKVSIGFYQQDQGKRRESFGAAVTTPLQADTNRQLLIAIVPLDGGSISDAERVRVTITGFGVFASRVDINPLRKMGIGGPVGTVESVGDGVFNLIGGYRSNSIVSPLSNADRIISLKIEPSLE